MTPRPGLRLCGRQELLWDAFRMRHFRLLSRHCFVICQYFYWLVILPAYHCVAGQCLGARHHSMVVRSNYRKVRAMRAAGTRRTPFRRSPRLVVPAAQGVARLVSGKGLPETLRSPKSQASPRPRRSGPLPGSRRAPRTISNPGFRACPHRTA